VFAAENLHRQVAVTEPLISLRAASTHFGVGYRTLLERIEVGELEAYDVRAPGAKRPRWRLAPEAIERWLASRATGRKHREQRAVCRPPATGLGTLPIVFTELDPATGEAVEVRCDGRRLVIEVVRDGGERISRVTCERPGAAERLRDALSQALKGRA
jgi:hypothetical protein